MAVTFDRVKEVFKEITSYESLAETTALCTLHLDTLDLVALIGDLEDEFSIQFEDEVVEDFKTVGEIVKYVDKKLAEKDK